MTKLKFATFAGPDDRTNISDLIDASNKNVELAVLYCPEKQGEHRFPTNKWIEELLNTPNIDAKLSIHLCGSSVKELINKDKALIELISRFDRIQINTNAKSLNKKELLNPLINTINELKFQFIMQSNRSNNDSLEYFPQNTHILLDASGGRGVTPEKWTDISKYGDLVGYAGGIGPDNIDETINKLELISQSNYWVDMESAIRTNNEFDISKCKEVMMKVNEAIE